MHGRGIFLHDKNEQHGTAVYISIFIQKLKNIISSVKNKRRNSAGEWLLCANSEKLY